MTHSINEDTLLDYLDGQLDARRSAEVEAALQHDPALRRKLEALQRLRRTLTEVFDAVDLLPAARATSAGGRHKGRDRRGQAFLAGRRPLLLLALSAGIILLLLLPALPRQERSPAAVSQPTVPATPTAPAFVAGADELLIGISVEPDKLTFSSMTSAQVIEYTYKEPWVLKLDYTYRANPRFLEGELPSIDNGGARFEQVVTGGDASAVITSTETATLSTSTQLVVTFKMRAGIRWSDGAALTSRDVVFGHQLGCAVVTLAGLLGSNCEQVERVEALDDYSWQVLYRPGARVPDYRATLNGANQILPQHQLAGLSPEQLADDPRVIEHPLGWGPYRIEQGAWEKGTALTLVRNEHYIDASQGLPRIPQLVFQFIPDTSQIWAALYAGELHLTTSDALQADLAPTISNAETAGRVSGYFLPSTTWEHLDFNFNDPADLSRPSLLADRTLRRAIAHGANRELYIEAVYAGFTEVSHSPLPPQHWAYPGDNQITVYAYDPELANRLLDEAGYRRGADGIRGMNGRRLSFTLRTVTGAAMREKVAKLFSEDMAQLGIEIKFEPQPASQFFGAETGLARRDFEIGMFAWVSSPTLELEQLYSCGAIPTPQNGWAGQNFIGWCNPTADAALQQAARSHSPAELKRLYATVLEQFTADLPSLPLFHRLQIYAATPQLANLKPSPSETLTWNVAEWELPAGSR